MGFALLAYQGAPGVNAASFDLTALADADFSQRNGHYVFSENYQIIAAAAMETSATRANFSSPTLNAIGKPNVWPVMRSIVVPSPPLVDLKYYSRMALPVNEEFQFQTSNNLGAATEQAYGFLWLATPDFSANLPAGRMPIVVRATATFTPPALAWSGPQALTFEQALRGGVYAVVGAEVQGTNLIAFRLIFPRYRLYQGRKLRPGSLCQNAIGDIPLQRGLPGENWLGEWGRFHTFEPVQIESLITAAASTAHEVRLWLVFLGEDTALLNQGLGGGGLAGQPQQPQGMF